MKTMQKTTRTNWIIFRKKIIKRANRQTVAKEMRKADLEAAAAAAKEA